MIEFDYSRVWKNFISKLTEVKIDEADVKDALRHYHSSVKFGLAMLGWNYGADLFGNYSGSRITEGMEFYIYKGITIPFFVKLPSNVMTKAYKEQLIEEMRLIETNIGIYIGEHIRVFYRPSKEDEFKIVIDAALMENDIEGEVFAQLFYKPHFDTEWLRSVLDDFYKLEQLIDDLYLLGKMRKHFSLEWIKDRYAKRSHLQASEM